MQSNSEQVSLEYDRLRAWWRRHDQFNGVIPSTKYPSHLRINTEINPCSGPNSGTARRSASPLSVSTVRPPSSLFDHPSPSTAHTSPNTSHLHIPISSQPLIINANDGGGVRAYSSLLVFKRIEQRLKEKGMPDFYRPKDWMDLSVGTSGGGLNTLLLARLGMTVDEAMEAMETTSKLIFDTNWFKKLKNRIFQAGARLNPTNFEKVLRDTVQRVTGFAYAPMEGGDPDGCKAAVVAVDKKKATHRIPTLLRSYEYEGAEPASAPIWECARATSAAPTYLPSLEVDGVRYMDGGLAANNPCGVAVREARKIWKGTGRGIGAIISIGTGSGEPVPWNSARPDFIAAMLTTDLQVHNEMVDDFDEEPDTYFRFQVPGLGDKVEFTDWTKLDVIKTETEAYLDQPDTVELVDKLTDKLFTILFPKSCA